MRKKSAFMGRKRAEIISFVLSLSVIISLFIFLIYDFAKTKNSPFLDIETKVLMDQKKKEGSSFIFPVEILNKGNQTAVIAVFRVEIKSGDEVKESHFEVEYLTKHGKHKVYLASEADPGQMEIKVMLESYQL